MRERSTQTTESRTNRVFGGGVAVLLTAFATNLAISLPAYAHPTFKLENGKGEFLSVPADPQGRTVRTLFGDDLDVNSFLSTWGVYVFNNTSQVYNPASLDQQIYAGDGFWIFQSTGRDVQLDVPDNLPVPTSTFSYSLPASSGSAWALVGNPFPWSTPVSSYRFDTNSGRCANGCTLSSARRGSPSYTNEQLYTYDSGTGAYAEDSPGDYIHPWRAYWVSSRSTNGLSPRLLIPRSAPVQMSCPATPFSWRFVDRLNTNGYWGSCSPGSNIGTRSWFGGGLQAHGIVRPGTPGANFSIDWDIDAPVSGHAEFDISAARDIYSAKDLGFGTTNWPSGSLDSLIMSSRGIFETASNASRADPAGKLHVQALFWLTSRPTSSGSPHNIDINKKYDHDNNPDTPEICVTPKYSIDITVAEYMPETIKRLYDAAPRPGGALYVGEMSGIWTGGQSYAVYKRQPGDVCEVVSYLAIRKNNLAYTLGFQRSEVNVGRVIKWLQDNDGIINSSWYINTLAWEITGASEDGQARSVGDSKARFRFSCYSIPGLNGSRSGAGYNFCR